MYVESEMIMELSSANVLCIIENMAQMPVPLLFNHHLCFKNIRHSHKEYGVVDK